MSGVNAAVPNEPPPAYTENAPGAPPRHSNDIPLPDSPITTHNPSPFPTPRHPPHQPPRPQEAHSSSSAAQYFASRPYRSILPIALPLKPNSVRADFYYPRDWAPDHDVSLKDWTTFVEFLVPDDEVRGDEKRLSPERREAVEVVLAEWNDGFFLPRGLRMSIDDGTGQQMPQRGASSASTTNPPPWSNPYSTESNPGRVPSQSSGSSPFLHRPSGPDTRPGAQSAYHPSNAPYRQQSTSSSLHGPPGSSRERWTQKLKDIAHEKDITASKEGGVRMSDKFSLSKGGLKVGRFNLDERGMNYGGKPIGPTLPVAQHHAGPPPQGSQPGYPGYGCGPGNGHRPPQGGFAPPAAQYGGRPPPQGGFAPPVAQYGGRPPPQGGFAPPGGPPPGHFSQQQTGTM